MRNFLSASTLALLLLGSTGFASEQPSIGVVNFGSCLTQSKAGKQEQENMENLRKQISSMMEETEKELKELTAKLEDTEQLDSLSPKAEEDLKMRHQALQDDLARYQGQFYQILSQANYQMVQKVGQSVSQAAQKVAEAQSLDYIINQEACFYISPKFDFTSSVIQEMDQTFDAVQASQNETVSENESSSLEEALVQQGE